MTDAPVLTGLQRLVDDPELRRPLEGRRLGLLVNPTSVTQDLTHAIEALRALDLDIHRLFGPEHGVRADAQDMESVHEQRDPISGLPCVSLYGDTFDSLRPSPGDLDGLDCVICDIQDIGARYYTYVYTIGLMMDACGDAGVDVLVLDRPNPIGGVRLEGNLVADDCRSFVGMQPIPTRHAMTAGELAQFFHRFGGWECDLQVIAMEGWQRAMWFDDTELPWVLPSPNMPTLDTATVYPGQCLLEGTHLSEGRGTTRPFELFGAPYIDAFALRDRLDEHHLPGVTFRPTAFRPTFQKWAGHTCSGLQLHITDRRRFSSLHCSYAILSAMLELYPDDFQWRQDAYEFVDDELAIDLLIGDKEVRRRLEDGAPVQDVIAHFADERAPFEAQRRQCLLYPSTDE